MSETDRGPSAAWRDAGQQRHRGGRASQVPGSDRRRDDLHMHP